MKPIFYQKKIGSVSSDVQVLNLNPTPYPLHFHSQFEFLYIRSGSVELNIDGNNHTLSEGDMAVIFSHQRHEYLSCSENTKGKVITAVPSVFSKYNNVVFSMLPKDPILRAESIDENFKTVLKWLFSTKWTDNNILNLRIHLINTLFWYFLEHTELAERTEPLQNSFQRVIEYCDEHYIDDEISLDKISEALGISKYYVSRLFSNNLNMRYSDYINSLRIRHACVLLKNSSYKIASIAHESGFNTIRQFNNTFVKHMKQTPSEYRENSRKILK